MKTAGIILLCFGGLNLLAAFIGLATGNPDGFAASISPAVLLGGIGAYLLHRTNQKKHDDQQRQQWLNGNQP